MSIDRCKYCDTQRDTDYVSDCPCLEDLKVETEQLMRIADSLEEITIILKVISNRVGGV